MVRRQDGDQLMVLITMLLTAILLLGESSAPVVEPLEVPCGERSHLPNLAMGADGNIYLSWVEPLVGGGDRLRFSLYQPGKGWGAAQTIASGRNWFVNWADFPSMTALADGTLAAHWLARLGEGTYAYGVKLSISRDRGKNWGEAIIPHSDRSPSEHGFVALRPLDEHHFFVAWLDGRAMAADSHGSGEMGLRAATLSADGILSEERLLDDRVCECCPVDALVNSAQEVWVVYRDRSIEEIRDIHRVQVGESTSKSLGPIHEDGWSREGCPVNGPAITSSKTGSAIAWYTEVEERGQVRARSLDKDSSPVLRIDDGNPIGRVDLAALEDGSFVACWLERVGDGAEVRVRRWSGNGDKESSHTIASTDPGRRSGFPRIVASGGNEVLVAWTTLSTGAQGALRIHSAIVRFGEKLKPDPKSS